jgi:hypothetical protein
MRGGEDADGEGEKAIRRRATAALWPKEDEPDDDDDSDSLRSNAMVFLLAASKREWSSETEVAEVEDSDSTAEGNSRQKAPRAAPSSLLPLEAFSVTSVSPCLMRTEARWSATPVTEAVEPETASARAISEWRSWADEDAEVEVEAMARLTSMGAIATTASTTADVLSLLASTTLRVGIAMTAADKAFSSVTEAASSKLPTTS